MDRILDWVKAHSDYTQVRFNIWLGNTRLTPIICRILNWTPYWLRRQSTCRYTTTPFLLVEKHSSQPAMDDESSIWKTPP